MSKTVFWKDWIAVFKVKVTAKVVSITVRPDGKLIFWTAEPFANKPGMMIHHKKLECHAERLICFLQVHSHSGTFVWRHNTCLSQAVVFVNGIVLALACGVKRNLILKQSVHLYNVQNNRKNRKYVHWFSKNFSPKLWLFSENEYKFRSSWKLCRPQYYSYHFKMLKESVDLIHC